MYSGIYTNKTPIIVYKTTLNDNISYKTFMDNFANKFIGGILSHKSIPEMENYLYTHLVNMYPLLDISLSVHINDNNSVYISFNNTFYEELKKYYPEALF